MSGSRGLRAALVFKHSKPRGSPGFFHAWGFRRRKFFAQRFGAFLGGIAMRE